MTFEQTAFLAAQAEEYRKTDQLNRKLINLILDKKYQRLPFDYVDTMIDATALNEATWHKALYAYDLQPRDDLAPACQACQPRCAVVCSCVLPSYFLTGSRRLESEFRTMRLNRIVQV